MVMLRSAKVIAASVTFAFSATLLEASEGSVDPIRISYNPDSRELTLTVPMSQIAAHETLDPPDWLIQIPADGGEAEPHLVTFRGNLPNTSPDEPDFGASESGSFLLGTFDWLPASMSAGANVEVLLTVPASHRAVAPGDLVSESLTPETYAARFAVPGGFDELAVFFGPYVIDSYPAEDTDLRTYFPPEHAGHSDAYQAATAEYLARFEAEIGDYPFAGFSIVSAPIPVGYGFGGLTYVSERILAHPYMLGRSLAHEVLHSWWGAGVGVDYEAGNWAEGLTTYQADYALAEDQGSAEAKEMRREWLAALSSLPSGADRPLREFVSAGHDRDQSIGYGKAAMLFHMLEREIGDAAFTSGLRRFWDEMRGSMASWSDLQAAFEDASSRDLDWFFDQWLDRSGLPSLRPAWAEVQETGSGFEVEVTLEQEGDPYRLSVPLHLRTGAGETTHVATLSEPVQTFTLETIDRPVSIAVDPDFHVARVLAEGELPPTVRDIMRAAAPALLTPETRETAADALAQALFGSKADLAQANLDQLSTEIDAVLVAGEAAEVAAIREHHFKDDIPDIAASGRSRAWVERDDRGRTWLFASSDDVSALAEDLSTLRYYGSQSYLSVDGDGEARPTSGRWPVMQSPMSISLD